MTHFVDGIGISLARLSPISRCRGRFGRISLYRHPELGRVFILGSEIQHVEAWAPLYHEPLVHLPAAFVKEVKSVLILGGGTLYAASEALKYPSVEKVVLVDHDLRVIQMVAKYYGHAKRCLRDHRFTAIEGDAYTFLSNLEQRFDLIINDGADLLLVGSRGGRKRSNIFSSITKALTQHGVCADVVYRHLFERMKTLRTLRLLRSRFRVALSLVFLPEYHGVLHLLLIWGRKSCSVSQRLRQPKNSEQLDWINKPDRSPCIYYDPRFLRHSLYLPRYVRRALKSKRKAV